MELTCKDLIFSLCFCVFCKNPSYYFCFSLYFNPTQSFVKTQSDVNSRLFVQSLFLFRLLGKGLRPRSLRAIHGSRFCQKIARKGCNGGKECFFLTFPKPMLITVRRLSRFPWADSSVNHDSDGNGTKCGGL